ncbi:MAG TPA: hypothetical protein VFF43_16320, partial [Caldimonas sp.]|nr:hypothetical protein [Caldimonas sp.]
MDEAPLIVLLFGLAVFVVIVAPLLALLSWVKVRDLERRVNELARREPAKPPVEVPAVTAAAPAGPLAPTPPPAAAPTTPVVPAPVPVAPAAASAVTPAA